MRIGAQANEFVKRAHRRLLGQRVPTCWPERIARAYPPPPQPSPQAPPSRAGALADITVPRSAILINYPAIRI
jgi:hypothetical protein